MHGMAVLPKRDLDTYFTLSFFQVKGDLSGIPVMLVGNKSDDNDKREVNTSTGEALQVKIVEKLHFYFHLKNYV